ncbi:MULTISPECIES: transposase [Corynebacterium]|uniref:transposase n=1 Tax=Corynebacterium TaxID=1716 RepID=UPI0002E40CDE|nr:MULTISPECIES: transposase [Corynebacterium]
MNSGIHFSSYATAIKEHLPTVRRAMTTFHVVHLAAGRLTAVHPRFQQEKYHCRGREDDPLNKCLKALLTSKKR